MSFSSRIAERLQRPIALALLALTAAAHAQTVTVLFVTGTTVTLYGSE
jgi:hypothetical protein